MSIISFSAKDKLAAVVMEEGWQTGIFLKIDGPKESQSKKSFSWYADIAVQGGKYDGKEVTVCFNTGVNSSSMLNGIQYMPLSQMLPFVAAINNVKLSEVNEQYNTDDLLHRPFDMKVIPTTVDGGLLNMITAVVPKGSGNGAVPF